MNEWQTAWHQIGCTMDLKGCVLGTEWREGSGEELEARSPIDGSVLANFRQAGPADVKKAIDLATNAFQQWRVVPAPRPSAYQRGGLQR